MQQYPDLEPIALEYLSEGKVLRKANELIQEAARDCVAKPNITKGRVITLTVALWPSQDEDGVIEVVSDGKASLSLPGLKFGQTVAKVDSQGRVLVSPYQSQAAQMDVEAYANVQKIEREREAAAE